MTVPGRHAFEHPTVDRELLVLARDVAIAAGEEEFRSVQPDPLGAGVPRGRQVVGKLDVRVEPDAHAVGGGGRRTAARVVGGRGPVIVGVPGRARELLRPRIDDELARPAVDHDELAGLNDPARVVEADDGRDVERAGEDRGVIRAAAGVGGEAADPRPVHLRGERRGELVGDEHGRLVQLAQQIARRGGAVAQVHLQPADEVGDVALPLAQVGIGDLVEDGAELLEHLLDGPFRVDAIDAHDLGRARHHHRVVEHQELGIEERGELAPPAARDARPDVDELLARPRAALLEPAQLVLDPRRPARGSGGPGRAG